MSLLKALAEKFPIERQLEIAAAPASFTLNPVDEPGFLDAWTDDNEFTKRQPDFISVQLDRAIGNRPTCLNDAAWASTEAFRAAFAHPEVESKLSAYPSTANALPHLFQKVAIAGICTA